MPTPIPLQDAPNAPPICPSCRTRAIAVWVRSDLFQFSDARCDTCAEQIARDLGARNVRFDSVSGVPRVLTIDDVNVGAWPRECLAGVHDAVDLQQLWTLPSAVDEIARALSDKIRRPLRPSELVSLRITTTLAYGAHRTHLNQRTSSLAPWRLA